jgi:DNA repair protein RadC
MLAADAVPATILAPLADAALLLPFLDPSAPPGQALAQATTILTDFGGLLGLERATLTDLQTHGGLTGQQARQLQAALTLARRLVCAEQQTPLMVHSPADIGPLLLAEMRPLDQEIFRVILLRTDGAVLKMVDLYAGTHNSTTLEVAEVFREPIRQGADRILLAHNHPAGSIQVSLGDIAATQRLIAAGKLLEIPVEDHLVVGHTWVSIRELGLCDWD